MDLSGFAGFFARNQWTIIFYAAMIGLILLLRKRIEWQVFGIGLYKTKVGIKLMEKLGTKYRGIVQVLGLIGIGVGFIGMFFILGNLLYGLYTLIFHPEAPAVVGLVLPGISLPGQTLKVPLITGWIALFVVVVIHEFSHGVVSRAHDIKVKSSGLLIFGPIGGAFVEPDEKRLTKADPSVQHALYAAGPFSNIITGILFALIGTFLLVPLIAAMTVPTGVELVSVTEDQPAYAAGLREGMIISSINNVSITTSEQLSAEMDKVSPGQSAIIEADGKRYTVLTTQHPTDEESEKGYLGINLQTNRESRIEGMNWAVAVLNWIAYFLSWLFILSLGIGLANLLPLGPVDGGRMFQLASRQVTGNVKRGDWWWRKVSLLVLAIIIVLVFAPVLKALI